MEMPLVTPPAATPANIEAVRAGTEHRREQVCVFEVQGRGAGARRHCPPRAECQIADILNGLSTAGINLRRVEKEEFQQALDRMMENPDLVTLLRPLMAYNLSSTHEMRWIESTNEYTTQVLYRFGFQWPPTARGYVSRFVDTISDFDYFSV